MGDTALEFFNLMRAAGRDLTVASLYSAVAAFVQLSEDAWRKSKLEYRRHIHCPSCGIVIDGAILDAGDAETGRCANCHSLYVIENTEGVYRVREEKEANAQE